MPISLLTWGSKKKNLLCALIWFMNYMRVISLEFVEYIKFEKVKGKRHVWEIISKKRRAYLLQKPKNIVLHIKHI